MIELHIRDTNPLVTKAMESAFADDYLVTVSTGEIFDASADAIISPANSFGCLDGGIDLIYGQYFGASMEQRLRDLLHDQYYGELPVGQALVIETHRSEIPYLVSAPTMRIPASVSQTVNAYLAFRAALAAVLAHNAAVTQRQIRTVLTPGMCTGIGEMPPDRAARQMRLAYDTVLKGKGLRDMQLGQIWGEHFELLNCG
ncbi:macro domain-containing protein [Roseateles asaccharophilus]|uniref:O-acetyl-ADP-ribose deacetylase (Regulator of RNase III) n=1 Tax=Roseateles asaccharophilus TaxID=582607 RepID=A0ABU2AEP3_9BURK|nr:macro domain-containing protein [Roseateles asaccharophilus]MDR7335672.1 O-acetyl-ADP-ribose deacetylase (regulator of RNase III) [Roseateles asaccharophilus]